MWYECSDEDCPFQSNSTKSAQKHELDTGHIVDGQFDGIEEAPVTT